MTSTTWDSCQVLPVVEILFLPRKPERRSTYTSWFSRFICHEIGCTFRIRWNTIDEQKVQNKPHKWTATRTTTAWSSYWIPTCNAYRSLSWPATVSIQQDVGSGLKLHKEHMKYSSKHLRWVVMFARGVMTVVRSTSEYMYILLLSPTLCGSSKISCYMVLGQTRTTYSDCGVREKVRPGELRYEIINCL